MHTLPGIFPRVDTILLGELATPFIPAGLKKLNRRLTAGVFVSSFPIRSCRSSAINTKLQKRAPPFPGWNPLEHIYSNIREIIEFRESIGGTETGAGAQPLPTGVCPLVLPPSHREQIRCRPSDVSRAAFAMKSVAGSCWVMTYIWPFVTSNRGFIVIALLPCRTYMFTLCPRYSPWLWHSWAIHTTLGAGPACR